jgi:hypothetical protein
LECCQSSRAPKSCTSAAWLRECVPRHPPLRMDGTSACVAAGASFGRRFVNARRITKGRATSFRDLQPEAFEYRLAHADCLKGRTETDRQIHGGGTACVEARDWACAYVDGSDGRGLSESAVPVAPHNTHLPRRGLRPLATAGELAPPQGEAVDTPSPCFARLSGRR